MIASSPVAGALGGIVQGLTLARICSAASTGFTSAMRDGHGGIDPAPARGGPDAAQPGRNGVHDDDRPHRTRPGFAFAGILTVTGCLDVLMHRLLAKVRRAGGSSAPPR
ncbi:hypothetical protein NC658_10080 [Streptomyces griseoincarnatus]|uniref:Uncharacterized protein n=1 Tax=Streptomyces griseoincarnatus TaxID=29305 RepID=A0ABT0VRL3_STRGI|nr:hypothetical protein [Streptomyces griseoincarnatus]MCM2513605.1 hypothetical protein [Streptomyces griseoincarnatus]